MSQAQSKGNVVIAADTQEVALDWIAALVVAGYTVTATDRADEFLQLLRTGKVNAAVIFGGPLLAAESLRYEPVPSGFTGSYRDLAAYLAVRTARKEGIKVSGVYVMTGWAWKPPASEEFVVLGRTTFLTPEDVVASVGQVLAKV